MSLLFVSSLATYVAQGGLTGPLAGIYYTVEVGTATVTVESTTAVNPSTLSIATSTTAASGTGKSTGTGTSTNTASATQSSGAAVKVGPAALGGSIMGLFGMVALLA